MNTTTRITKIAIEEEVREKMESMKDSDWFWLYADEVGEWAEKLAWDWYVKGRGV